MFIFQPIPSAESKQEQTTPAPVKEKRHEGLKAAVLRRVKGEMAQEATTLIDPETGFLTPMHECEEGNYVPVSKVGTTASNTQATATITTVAQPAAVTTITASKTEEQQSPIVAQVPAQPVKQSIRSLKAHVLSSHAAKAVVTQQQPPAPKPVMVTAAQPHVSVQQALITKPTVPINQNLNISVTPPANMMPTHLSPRAVLSPGVGKPLAPGVKLTQPPLSPNQLAALQKQQHQHMSKQQQSQQARMQQHLTQMVPQVLTSPVPHVKPQNVKPLVMGKVPPMVRPHGLHQQQQILTGAVASPPLKQPHLSQQPMVAGANPSRLVQGSNKGMEPPKVEVSMGGCVMVPRSNASPQGQSRHVMQAGMPVPAYEASLVSVVYLFLFL